MGMFDRIWVECNCGSLLEFQSKAGGCILADYTINTAPIEILCDIIGCCEKCEQCESYITIKGNVSIDVGMPQNDYSIREKLENKREKESKELRRWLDRNKGES